MAKNAEKARGGWNEAWGILLLAACLLSLLSLLSYDPGDIPILQQPPNQPPANFIGPLGAWFSFIMFMGLGVGGYLVPIAIGLVGLFLLKETGSTGSRLLWMVVALLALITMAELQPELWRGLQSHLNVGSPGGLVGHLLGQVVFVRLLGDIGTAILAVAALVTSLVFLLEVHPADFFQGAKKVVQDRWTAFRAERDERKDERELLAREERELAKKRKRLERALERQSPRVEPEVPEPESEIYDEPEPPEPEPEVVEKPKLVERLRKPRKTPQPAPPTPAAEAALGAELSEYELPPMTLLDPLPSAKERMFKGDVKLGAQILTETLNEFGIDAEVTNAETGPVVTRYEVLPAPGVRVERIAGLSKNIALAMKAESVRVQAPIPGKGVVGIEVPNAETSMVYIREMLESDAWNSEMALPLCLGKDVGGREIVGDLADMPHLLIAGATGSGKTVCMNSILAGLLMTKSPDEMRLLLIDPKIVEFSGYNNLPHLVVPVITDAKKVPHGLRWAIDEMEKRYKLFARVGVRNIKAYNQRPIAEQQDLFGGGEDEEQETLPRRLPYIAIIVDELADLMLVAQAEIENYIARLAQLSRAVGIHMILATQRPSVNVITGTIKANFPARIAFKVAQKVDSRTILDANGADMLLGKGDMLFLPPGSHKLIRAQGTMTKDKEVRDIVDFIRERGQPRYEQTIKAKLESKSVDIPEAAGEDDLLDTAIEIIRQTQRASTSSLQRRLRIGYTRAARLMDLLEEKGVVGPPRGSDPREILIDLDGEIPQNVAEEVADV